MTKVEYASSLVRPLAFTGLGPVGLGGVINARYRRARVVEVEPNPLRAQLATRLGAELVIDPADGRGAGSPDAVRACRQRKRCAA